MKALAMTLSALLAAPLYAGQHSAQMRVSVLVIGPRVIQESTYKPSYAKTESVHIRYEANEQSCSVSTRGNGSAQVLVQCDAYAVGKAISVTPLAGAGRNSRNP